MREAERMDLGVTAATMLHSSAAQLHALRGEGAPAREHLDRARRCIELGLPGEFETPYRSAAAALALAERDPGAAREHAATALSSPPEPLYTPVLLWLGIRAEADAAEADRAHRRAVELTRVDELLAAFPEGGAGARAHRELALAERARAAGAPDPALWRAAADRFDALGEPYPAAYARLREAEALLSGGSDRRTAAERLWPARATAAELAAAPLLEEIDALARRGRISPEPAPAAPEHGGAGTSSSRRARPT